MHSLLSFLDPGAGIRKRLVERGDLRFEIDLARDACLGKVVTSGIKRRADLVVEFAYARDDLVAAACDAKFLDAGTADSGARFLDSRVDFAERLLNQRSPFRHAGPCLRPLEAMP